MGLSLDALGAGDARLAAHRSPWLDGLFQPPSHKAVFQPLCPSLRCLRSRGRRARAVRPSRRVSRCGCRAGRYRPSATRRTRQSPLYALRRRVAHSLTTRSKQSTATQGALSGNDCAAHDRQARPHEQGQCRHRRRHPAGRPIARRGSCPHPAIPRHDQEEEAGPLDLWNSRIHLILRDNVNGYILRRQTSGRMVPPKPDGLMADVDPALGQEILDVAQRQGTSRTSAPPDGLSRASC